jgi:hypothetical protein
VSYYHVVDMVGLHEPNVIFELNGKFFRKQSELFGTHHMAATIGERLRSCSSPSFPAASCNSLPI